MQMWVDADACPSEIKELLYRAAMRRKIKVTLVANQQMRTPKSEYVDSIIVPAGMNVADRRIAALIEPGDLVVTSDIPLAAEVIEKGAYVITSRGERYTRNNIGQRLNMRDFMETMRSSMAIGGGPPALGSRDKQAFANALDTYLAKYA